MNIKITDTILDTAIGSVENVNEALKKAQSNLHIRNVVSFVSKLTDLTTDNNKSHLVALEIIGNARLICNVVQDISTLPRCTVGGEFLIGGKRYIHIDDDEHNTPVVAILDSELEYKFISDEINALKDSLDLALTLPNNTKPRKMKV